MPQPYLWLLNALNARPEVHPGLTVPIAKETPWGRLRALWMLSRVLDHVTLTWVTDLWSAGGSEVGMETLLMLVPTERRPCIFPPSEITEEAWNVLTGRLQAP